jgi:hypothetical protein
MKGFSDGSQAFVNASVKNEALVRNHFEIDAPIRKLVAIRAAHHDQAGSANAHVHLNDWCRPRPRRKPLFKQLRNSPGLEHFFAGRVDDSCKQEVSAFGGSIRFIGRHELYSAAFDL